MLVRFFSFFLLTSALLAQSAPVPASRPITVPLFVSDHKGPTKVRLKKDNLVLRDDNKNALSIIDVEDATALPLRIGVVIDTSNSQRSNAVYKRTVQEIIPFLRSVMTGANDRAFVETFDSVPNKPSNFVDANHLNDLTMSLTLGGATAFYDAIVTGCDKLNTDTPVARRVLVILGDGDDNQSHHTRDEAIKRALELSVALITLNTGHDSDRGMSELKHVAEATGGFSFTYLDDKRVPGAFITVSEFVSNMYEVAFLPTEDKPGKLRKFDIQVTDPPNLTLWRPKQYVSK